MEAGFVVYGYAVPPGLGLPGVPALEPMRTAAFLRSAPPQFSEYSGSSEPIWGDISPGGPPGSDAKMKINVKGALGVKSCRRERKESEPGPVTMHRINLSALSILGTGGLSFCGPHRREGCDGMWWPQQASCQLS